MKLYNIRAFLKRLTTEECVFLNNCMARNKGGESLTMRKCDVYSNVFAEAFLAEIAAAPQHGVVGIRGLAENAYGKMYNNSFFVGTVCYGDYLKPQEVAEYMAKRFDKGIYTVKDILGTGLYTENDIDGHTCTDSVTTLCSAILSGKPAIVRAACETVNYLSLLVSDDEQHTFLYGDMKSVFNEAKFLIKMDNFIDSVAIIAENEKVGYVRRLFHIEDNHLRQVMPSEVELIVREVLLAAFRDDKEAAEKIIAERMPILS